MAGKVTDNEAGQLKATIEMFEIIAESQPLDIQSLDILKESYSKLGMEAEALRTSKRIAEAYVQLGQISSAIFEYETILQHHPNDAEVKRALASIEDKASSLGAVSATSPTAGAKVPAAGADSASDRDSATVKDGQEEMRKIFVDSKFISAVDFDLCWSTPPLDGAPGKVIEPFIQALADKKIKPMEDSLRLLCEKSRVPFMSLERYNIDVEFSRKASKEICQRWCLLPFDRMSMSALIATANPFNQTAAKELTGALKCRLIWYIAPPLEIDKAIKQIFR